MTTNIEGKCVLITGGGTGLGAETARMLASKGAKIAIAARRRNKLDDVAAGFVSGWEVARAYELDVADKKQFKSVVDAVVADLGRLDVLVNNAGLMPIRPMAEVNTDEWDAMIDVNLRGTLYGIAAALPLFMEQNSGHFVNISSVAGVKVFAPGGTVYSGTKFAVRAISEGLRQEVGSRITGDVDRTRGSGKRSHAHHDRNVTWRGHGVLQVRDSHRIRGPRHYVCRRTAGRCRHQRDRPQANCTGILTQRTSCRELREP